MDWSDLFRFLGSNGYVLFLVGSAIYTGHRIRSRSDGLADALDAKVVRSSAGRRALKGRQNGRAWRLELKGDANQASVIARFSVKLRSVPRSVAVHRKKGRWRGVRTGALGEFDEAVGRRGAGLWRLLLFDAETRVSVRSAMEQGTLELKDGRLVLGGKFGTMDPEVARLMIGELHRLADLLDVEADTLRDRAIAYVLSDASARGRGLALRALLRIAPGPDVTALAAQRMVLDPADFATPELFELAASQGWDERLVDPKWAAHAPEDSLAAYVDALDTSRHPGVEDALIRLLPDLEGELFRDAVYVLGHRGTLKAVGALNPLKSPDAKAAIRQIQERLGAQPGGLAVVDSPAEVGALSLDLTEGAVSLEAVADPARRQQAFKI